MFLLHGAMSSSCVIRGEIQQPLIKSFLKEDTKIKWHLLELFYSLDSYRLLRFLCFYFRALVSGQNAALVAATEGSVICFGSITSSFRDVASVHVLHTST